MKKYQNSRTGEVEEIEGSISGNKLKMDIENGDILIEITEEEYLKSELDGLEKEEMRPSDF